MTENTFCPDLQVEKYRALKAAESEPAENEKLAEYAAQLERTRAERAAAVPANEAAFSAATEQYKSEVGNIHERAFGITADRQPAEPAEFSSVEFERAFGMAPGYLDGQDEATAHQALKELYPDSVREAHQAVAVETSIDNALERLSRRLESHFDSWSSEKYGTSSMPLTDEQTRERERLARAVSLHAGALTKAGEQLPRIEVLLNRCRLQLDKNWMPRFNKPKAPYRSIHDALMRRT
jgi:hypothetical protein